MGKDANKELKITVLSQEDQASHQAEKVEMISLDKITDFKNHPFKVKDDEDMRKMVESVREYGVLNPILVRPKADGNYEIISGHRRKRASEIVRKTSIPAIVRNLTDDEATIIMVDSNLQREEILPSEKAFAYKMKLEAISRQGTRSDLTSTPMESKLRSNEIVGEQNGESREQVRRYIRLTVNDKIINLKVAEQLSFLRKREQEIIDNMIKSENKKFTENQIKLLKEASKEEYLTQEKINEILNCKDKEKKINIAFSKSELSEFFGDVEDKRRIKKYIMSLLKEKNGENSIVESGVKNEL